MIHGLGNLAICALVFLQLARPAMAAGTAPAQLDIQPGLQTEALEPLEQPSALSAPAPNSLSLSLSIHEALNAENGQFAHLEAETDQPSELDYSINETVSVGVGYSFVEAENLGDIMPAAGLVDVDHQSHHVLLRAKWHFGS